MWENKMTRRKDGRERKKHLLEAATRVFAKKGFRDTTVLEICEAADSNVASVNYYFGSKEGLYAQIWKRAFEKSFSNHPARTNADVDAPAPERLKNQIKAILDSVLGSGADGYIGQILLMELTNPTEAIQMVKREAIDPLRGRMLAIMRELLGQNATNRQLAFCGMSVAHQCLGFSFKKGTLPPIFQNDDKEEFIKALAEHIYTFSMAGISAVRQQIESEE